MKLLECSVSRSGPIVLVTLSIAVLACGDRKSGVVSSARRVADSAAPAMITTSAAGSDSVVLRLAAATDTTLAGTRVRLAVAHVQSVMSTRGFWIGVWGQQVYVFQAPPSTAPVQGGEAYVVVGTVRVAPHSAQAAPRGMTPIDIEALHAQYIYIVADTVTGAAR